MGTCYSATTSSQISAARATLPINFGTPSGDEEVDDEVDMDLQALSNERIGSLKSFLFHTADSWGDSKPDAAASFKDSDSIPVGDGNTLGSNVTFGDGSRQLKSTRLRGYQS